MQAPQLGWHLSGVGSTLANSDFVDNIVSDLIEVLSKYHWASLWKRKTLRTSGRTAPVHLPEEHHPPIDRHTRLAQGN